MHHSQQTTGPRRWGFLFTTLMWGALSTSGLSLPQYEGTENRPTTEISHILASRSEKTSVSAIVQLQGLEVPAPRIKGQARLPLSALPGTSVYTLNGQLQRLSTRWLVDTGASTSMVATPVVTALNLKGQPIPNQRLAFAVAGNDCPNLDATLHQLPALQLQEVQVEGLQGLQFANTVIPADLSGVLGMDVLSQFDLYLHPGKSTLSLLPPTPLPKDAIATAVPLEKKLGVMVAQLQINGQGPFRVLLDTAAESTFISEQVAARLNLDAATLSPIQIRGFCGLENAMRSQLNSVTLHQHQRRDLEVIILSSSILKVLKVDGILGQNFLRHYQQYWRFNSDSGSLLLVPLARSTPAN
ncbi:retroviral-like aspartic protease family protein [Acaryochloris sp. IP29b_bin.148]|uniref:retroviral-like aspartic protease family protein n=1 Tax=Acaryochloris sp. IP29b_bin.148 TaxID=2969218 RepID=UPI002608A144|nr:retroviral-like aspartic protease family protein [Acaryochloris sp. IP29b_bin.148]